MTLPGQQESCHYSEVIIGAMASQITSLTIVYLTVYSGADQRKHQSSASLAFVRGIHQWPMNSPHKGPVTQKMFPFDYVIMRGVIIVCNLIMDANIQSVVQAVAENSSISKGYQYTD